MDISNTLEIDKRATNISTLDPTKLKPNKEIQEQARFNPVHRRSSLVLDDLTEKSIMMKGIDCVPEFILKENSMFKQRRSLATLQK